MELFRCGRQKKPAGGALRAVTDYGRGLVTGRPGACPGLEIGRRADLVALVQRDEIVATAHMGVADEDLRHGAAAGAVHHGLAFLRVQVHADLLDLLDAALLQQHLGADAERADLGGVHLHGGHGRTSLRRFAPGDSKTNQWGETAQAVFSTGRLASRQAFRPPASTWAFS
jgi:hypothetical protein